MITIIHGDNVVLSRKKLDHFQDGTKMLERFDATKSDLIFFTQTLKSQSLFFEKKTVIIENFFQIKGDFLKKAVLLLNDLANSDLEIIIWEGKQVNTKLLKEIHHSNILLFDLPKRFYQFLDGIKPSKGKLLVNLFLEIVKNNSSELVFYSLLRRIKMLLVLKTKEYKEFEEFKNLQDWQIKKLVSQAKYWREKELLEFYKNLFSLECNLKTSNLPMSITKHLDILLLTL